MIRDSNNDTVRTTRLSKKSTRLNLDEVDYAIVNLLQENADRSGKEISSIISGLGFFLKEAAVNNRIRKLKEAGYIKCIIAQIDYSRFGYNEIYFLFVKFMENPTAIDTVIKRIHSFGEIFEAYEIVGEFDFILKLRAPSLAEAVRISKALAREASVRVSTVGVAETIKETIIMKVPRGESH